MDWAEVYPALQQGVVDGRRTRRAVSSFREAADVQKYYSLTST